MLGVSWEADFFINNSIGDAWDQNKLKCLWRSRRGWPPGGGGGIFPVFFSEVFGPPTGRADFSKKVYCFRPPPLGSRKLHVRSFFFCKRPIFWRQKCNSKYWNIFAEVKAYLILARRGVSPPHHPPPPPPVGGGGFSGRGGNGNDFIWAVVPTAGGGTGNNTLF